MRTRTLTPLLACIVGLTSLAAFVASAQEAAAPAAPAAAPATQPTVRVMSFNLRYAAATGPNAWPVRRPVMVELLRAADPDVIGTQEGLYPQLKDLASDLPAYRWIGIGRNGGSRGEFMAIFYRAERLEPLEFDHFWLSDTPDVIGSITWGANLPRMCTWVRFLDRKTGRQFYFFNTHLDHQSEPSRVNGAKLIRKRIDALKTELPVILVGDFNTGSGSDSHKALTEEGGLADAWDTAADNKGPRIATFHNYRAPIPNGKRIDWILHRGPLSVRTIEILTFSKDGQYPSDHFPVQADVQWTP